jgi:hypothetical protein
MRLGSVIALLASVAMLSATASPAAAADPVGQAAPAAVVPLNSCAPSDNGNPDLLSTSVTPATVDVRQQPATVTLRLDVADDAGPGPSSGIASVLAQLGYDELALTRAADGTWQREVAVPVGSTPGIRALSNVMIEDHAGNRRVYTTEDLQAAGLGAAVTVVSNRDRTKPVLRDLHLSKTSVNTLHHARRVRVSARVTDDVGVREVSVFAISSDASKSSSVLLHRVSGTATDGRWAGVLTIRTWQGTGTWRLGVNPADSMNTAGYGVAKLARRHFPSVLHVRSRRDGSDPRVRSAKSSASDIDVRTTDGLVVITMHATDTGSGLGSVDMELRRPGHIQDLAMSRVAGTRRDGTWRLVVPLHRCDSRTGTWWVRFFVQDRSGRRGSTGRIVTFHVRNTDIHGADVYPTPTSMTRNGPFTIDFSEDVTGLSNNSAVVRATPYEKSSPGDPPPAVAGSWSCRTAAGASVDCVAGPLRHATWTPAQPLAAGVTYQVDFNPEHVLDLTDTAGNPINRYEEVDFGPEPR